MKYTLNNESNNKYESQNIKSTILKMRGIDNVDGYCNPTSKYENHYSKLKNIDKAVKCLIKHIEEKNKIDVIVDEDADGFSSASALINYLKRTFADININYILHTKRKAHGLSKDIIISGDTKLVILPDAGSNDYEEHFQLQQRGIDVICLDHHQVDTESKYAIIVNNQLYNYPNKSLCGVGVVYKFLQALDEELWLNYADDYLDLTALGLISDNMDVRNLETKYYINKGLSNIKNKQIKAFIDRQQYKLNGIINMINIAFYITPLINAMIRIGRQEEKLLLFKGFLEEYVEFDYKPRGKEEIIKETIYDRAARICANTKTRQDKTRNKAFEDVIAVIEKTNKNNDKILLVNCSDIFENSLTGVVAIKVASKYNKPCILLRKEALRDGFYGGSGRNTNKNEVSDLKQFLNDSGLFDFAEGHPSAFGTSINKENIPKFIEYANEKLRDVNFDGNTYIVDFVIPFEDLNDEFIYEIDMLKGLWSKGVDEPIIAIKEVEIKSSEIQVLGKSSNTLKFNVDGVDFIKFFIDKNEKIISDNSDWENDSDKTYILNVIGKCSSNVWNGEKKPQIIIEDYEIIKTL